MANFRVIALLALVALFLGVVAVGDAAAGEKFKLRAVRQNVKWEQIAVGDQEGHVFALAESKGIQNNMEGKAFCNGWFNRDVGFFDLNLKTGVWSGHGCMDLLSPGGDKIFMSWEGSNNKGTCVFVKGTGKFEGIKSLLHKSLAMG